MYLPWPFMNIGAYVKGGAGGCRHGWSASRTMLAILHQPLGSIFYLGKQMTFQRYDFGDGLLVPARVHPNGGGIVALTADVAPTVYIGAGCTVSGGAKVCGHARIVGRVQINGDISADGVSVLIEDHAIVAGSAKISGKVLIRDRAEVRDNAQLSGAVAVMHRAHVAGDAVLRGDIQVMDEAYIGGSTRIVSIGRRVTVRGEKCFMDEQIEHVVQTDRTRKRRASTARAVVYDHQIA